METPQKSNLTTDPSSALVRFIIYHAVHRKTVQNEGLEPKGQIPIFVRFSISYL